MFQYFGGKTRLLKYIVPLIDAIPHKKYHELFGGSGKVLLNKKPSEAEIWNDLDKSVFSIWSTVKCAPMELVQALCKMEYSIENFNRVKLMRTPDLFSLAVKTFTLIQQSRNGNSVNWSKSVRTARGMSECQSRWLNAVQQIPGYSKRIQKVSIHNESYVRFWDGADTLLYLDPPYVHSTRGSARYACDLTNEQQIQFCKFANSVIGHVIISGYPNPLYDHYLSRYRRVDIDHIRGCSSGQDRPCTKSVESLWLSEYAFAAYVRVFGSARAHDPNRR